MTKSAYIREATSVQPLVTLAVHVQCFNVAKSNASTIQSAPKEDAKPHWATLTSEKISKCNHHLPGLKSGLATFFQAETDALRHVTLNDDLRTS